MTFKFFLFALSTCVLTFPSKLYAQIDCQSSRFTNVNFFTEEQIAEDTGIVYGVATDWLGVVDTQKLDIAYPKLTIDTLKRRPFILLIHGGGYHTEDEFSNRHQWNEQCLMFAQRGFVSATIDYRVGWKDNGSIADDNSKNGPQLEPTSVFAVYRALQDARAALRFFVANAEVYGIDTNSIFVGGRSAGGDISLWIAFSNQRELDSLISEFIPEGCHNSLGSLDSSTNTIQAHFKIRGVMNMWGPIADTALISREEAFAIPIIMFHGTDDASVPFKKFARPEYAYTRYGSYFIAMRYRNLGACYELHTKNGGGHGEDFSREYLAEHISKFVKNVLCDSCQSQEFESEISLGWKFEQFLTSDLWSNVFVVLLLAGILFAGRRIYTRRKRK